MSRFADPEIYQPSLLDKVDIRKVERLRNGNYMEFPYHAYLTTDEGLKGLPYGRRVTERRESSQIANLPNPQRI